MGFFDKVKGMAGKLTGNTATVTLSVEGTSVKDTIKVNINATVKDAAIDVTKVYLYVKSVEKVNIPKNEMPQDHQHSPVSIEKEVFHQQEFTVAPAQKLEAGQSYSWTYELKLSGANIMPTYFGKYVSHEWEFYAGLDTKGNDPDSGWVAHQLF